MSRAKSIIILAIALLGSLIYMMLNGPPLIFEQARPNKVSTIQILYVTSEGKLSTDPDESDFLRNAVLMSQVVGTLVRERFGNTGEAEPFLAENWEVTSDKTIWSFKIKRDLQTENGEAILPSSFKRSIEQRLKHLSKSWDVPAFNKLVGWKSFTSGQEAQLRGIEYDDQSMNLTFRFTEAPEGFLEFLAMPNFGYYALENYDTNGNWKSKNSIISSGIFRLESLSNENTAATFKMRNSVLSNKFDTNLTVIYQTANWKHVEQIKDRFTLISSRFDSATPKTIEEFERIDGTPLFLTSIILSPFKDGPLSNSKFRKSFANSLRRFANDHLPKMTDLNSSDLFYAYSPYKPKKAEIFDSIEGEIIPSSDSMKGAKLTINYDPTHLTKETQALIEIIKLAASEYGLQIELAPDDFKNTNWLKQKDSNSYYDIRLETVDIGGSPQNWATRMMFCSKLGISFPDLNGDICELCDRYGKQSEIDYKSYLREFESLLRKHNTVIPMYHTGYVWFKGADLELEDFASTSVIPRFENLKARR